MDIQSEKEGINQLVTAIITTHNRINFLKRAVDSVKTQTYSNIELIVVDDGSTDRTQEWCESQDFLYIRIPAGDSRGGNYARNLGVYKAQGEFLAFLDDDDYWLPTKIEKQIALYRLHPGSVIYCLRKYESISSNTIGYSIETPRLIMQGDISRKCLFVDCVTSTSTLFLPKKIVAKAGYWDEKQTHWQDNDLIVRLAQIAEFFFVNEPLVVYTSIQGESQRISNQYEGWKIAARRFYRKYKNLYSGLTTKEKIQATYPFLIRHSIGLYSQRKYVKWLFANGMLKIVKFISPQTN